jgi:hypothetical protein
MSAEKIRQLNDAFRTTMTGGRVMMTAGWWRILTQRPDCIR